MDENVKDEETPAAEKPQGTNSPHNPFWGFGYGMQRPHMMMAPGFGYSPYQFMAQNNQPQQYDPLMEQLVVLQGQNQQLLKMMILCFATTVMGTAGSGEGEGNKIAPNRNVLQQMLPQLLNFGMGFGMQQQPLLPSPMVNPMYGGYGMQIPMTNGLF